MYLGKVVRMRRTELKMTQQQLATELGTTPSLIVALETGKRRYVSASDIKGLAKGLSLNESYLWSHIPEGKSALRYIPLY